MTSVPLLLVDGHNLLFRACFGTPAQIMSRDPEGPRDITTQFMFFALLRKAVTSELGSWPEIITVFDGEHGSAARKETDPGYKATRPGSDEALRPILALGDVKAGLDACGIPWAEDPRQEADDVIATLAAAAPGRDVLIMSADQDFYQLLRDPAPGLGAVRVLNTARRAGGRLTGPAGFTARYGVTPARYPDFRALCGDPSDNIPGVRGIGAKTAAALLAGGLALEDLPASGRLADRRGLAVTAAWEQVITWRAMIRMRTDLALATSPSSRPASPVPPAGQVMARLGLWQRPQPAEVPAPAAAATLW
jgi:DNA polymerase-1